MLLSAEAQRVLGALVEKELATPQSYPLSLNALRTACNQTTNREPVVDYDEATCRDALRELSGLDLVTAVYANRSNTPKYAHNLGEYLEIGVAGVSLLAVLMLRGPQTLGELRQRTDRLHTFEELADVAHELESLASHHLQPLVTELPRQPGQKETRWVQLLGGQEQAQEQPGGEAPTGQPRLTAPQPPAADADILHALQEEVENLRDEVETLKIELERLRRFVGA